MKRVGLTKKDCQNDTIQNLHIEQKKLDRLRKKNVTSKAKQSGIALFPNFLPTVPLSTK